MRLKGKLAVVTAGASGMGRAGCELFAREGATVAVVDINQKAAAEVANRIYDMGGSATAITADLSKAEECRRAIQDAAKSMGGIDILWAHAGIPGAGGVEEVTPDEFNLAMSLNVGSAFFTAGEAVKHMRKRGGGALIFTASVSGLVGSLLSPLYSAGKFGVVGLTKALSLRFAADNVRVNAICPGPVETPMLPEFMGRGLDDATREKTKETFINMIPLRRVALPEDVAQAAVWLASDEAAYITGVALPVDGGFTAK